MATIREALTAASSRLNANNGIAAPSIQAAGQKVLQVVNTPMTQHLGGMTSNDLKEVLKCLTGASNNVANRYSAIVKVMFRDELLLLNELKIQTALIESTFSQAVELSIVNQFADAGANTLWTDLSMATSEALVQAVARGV